MQNEYHVSLEKMIEDIPFEVVYLPKEANKIEIYSKEVSRPGLVFIGYDDYFESRRVQFLGLNETEYLKSLPQDERLRAMELLFQKKPSLVVLTRSLPSLDGMLTLADRYGVPIVRSAISTSSCMSQTISYLSRILAERVTRHGVMVEVYGEGVLILGNSGVGKSETAIELVKRGHRLIADDAVEIRKVSATTLLASAPENIRHFISLRGVGILNACRLFGVGAVKLTERIDLIVQLEPWNRDKVYEQLGLDDDYAEILGIRVPVCVVPVQPGRNLSIIIEAAAMNNRQRKMGENAALELMQKLGMTDEEFVPETRELELWSE
ncbi:MAG: HPr(Ser) kinase/phosphatase [Clostridia bacterium]|nr:HPr(Ser) kinase/phosphatase [Clostridia bacterium]